MSTARPAARTRVPRTSRRPAEREQKREEIVRAATKLFLGDGYEATSMQRIADEVEVAPNTLYWYFADKDALLVSVLDGLLRASLAEYEKRQRAPLQEQLLWLVELFSGMRSLIVTVHSRVRVSESVRAWHDGFHALLEATLCEQLRGQKLARGHEREAAQAALFIVEGMLAHELRPAEQRSLVSFLVSSVRRASA
jgi:AcrR family transcriptional regulator